MEFGDIDNTVGERPGEYPDRFQGDVKIQRFTTPFSDSPAVFAVHFEAGGRTRPHVHGSGQLLHVTDGKGIIADASGRRVVEPGDVVAVMPNEWHWHGATPTSSMTHVTVQLSSDAIDWDVEERDWADDYGA